MKKRTRVLFVANRSEVFSGGQISLIELVAGIDRNRFDISVLCPGEGGMSETLQDKGVDVILWDMPCGRTVNVFRTFRAVRELKNIIMRNGFDIVHTNGVRAQFYGALAVRNTDAKLVWHVRESNKDIFILDLFLREMSDRVICVSGKVLEEKFGYFRRDNEKFRVIYNGVDINSFRKDETEGRNFRYEFRIDDENILIGMVGLIEPLKGQEVLIESLKILKRKYPGIKLIFAGKTVDKEYAEHIKDMAKKYGLDNDIIFTGHRGDIVSFLSALDIFALPSRREGFSRALVEAMACSLPVVATDAGGNSEAVDDGVSGFLVPFGEPRALAGSIDKIISDKQLSVSFSERGRDIAEKKFSVNKYVKEVEDLYEDVRGGCLCG